jgi:hypothetical protein
MANPITVKINDREFNATLRKYASLSKRDPKQICDTKAFFVARGATRLTKRVSSKQITAELGKIVKTKAGRTLKLVAATFRAGESLAEAILRARYAKDGKAQPTKAQMGELIAKFIAARRRSIAFIAACNIPAIKRLAPLAWTKKGAPPADRQSKQYGQPKGSASPAQESWIARTTIVNAASASRDHVGAVDKYGSPAYRQALEDERQSMMKHMEDKLRKTAQQAGIKTR